jgi:hypothetical protein
MDALGEVPILYLGNLNTFSPEDTGPLAPSGDLGYTVIPMLTDENNIHACVYHDFFDVFRTINPSDPGFTYISSSYESRIDFIFANEFFEGKFSNATTGDTVSALSASDHLSVDAILALSENQTTSTSSQQTSTTTSSDVDSIMTKTASLIISLDLVGIGLIFVYMKRKQLKNT